MTPEIDEALRVGRALGYLEAIRDLLRLLGGLALAAVGVWAWWQWHRAKWRR